MKPTAVGTYSPYARAYHKGTSTRVETYDLNGKELKVYFSYATPIALEFAGKGIVSSRKYSTSTSKHTTFACRAIGGPFTMVTHEGFVALLEELYKAGYELTSYGKVW